jgi:LAS superfamily LD-carboxypeptidase LdcB
VPLKINSAYRTYPDQVRVRNEWEAKGDPSSAAYPGTSNHGFGRAVDFANGNGARLTPSMQQYKWIKANAGKYHFKRIYSSKKGRTEAWEAWHWQDTGPFTDQDFK